MHDYLLSMASDHTNERIKDDLTDFIVKTHNRNNFSNTPLTVLNTFIKESHSKTLERVEHEFSSVKIALSTPDDNGQARRLPSARSFSKSSPLSRATFETLIMKSYGARLAEQQLTYPYPSGGGLYSGQVIVYIKNVEGYEEGSYHYLPVSNQFEKLHSLRPERVDMALFMRDEKHLTEYDFFIFYGSLLDKHICKYGYRGYRLALLEIGSMYRNAELETRHLSLKNIVWGGFRDEALTVALGLDPRVMVPVICQLIGR